MKQIIGNILNRRMLHRVERRSPVLTVPAYRPHSCSIPAKSLLCFRSLPHPPKHFCLSSQFLNLHLTFSNTNYISFASRNGIFWLISSLFNCESTRKKILTFVWPFLLKVFLKCKQKSFLDSVTGWLSWEYIFSQRRKAAQCSCQSRKLLMCL